MFKTIYRDLSLRCQRYNDFDIWSNIGKNIFAHFIPQNKKLGYQCELPKGKFILMPQFLNKRSVIWELMTINDEDENKLKCNHYEMELSRWGHKAKLFITTSKSINAQNIPKRRWGKRKFLKGWEKLNGWLVFLNPLQNRKNTCIYFWANAKNFHLYSSQSTEANFYGRHPPTKESMRYQ